MQYLLIKDTPPHEKAGVANESEPVNRSIFPLGFLKGIFWGVEFFTFISWFAVSVFGWVIFWVAQTDPPEAYEGNLIVNFFRKLILFISRFAQISLSIGIRHYAVGSGV